VPEQVTNLFGIMLIRRLCKEMELGIFLADLKNLSLLFGNSIKVKPEAVVKLATQQSKKYQITPEQSLIIRLNSNTCLAF